MLRPAVFLDRDGTINVSAPKHDYIRDPAAFQWLPGALQALVRLSRAGWPLVVVSNQRGVSRGLVSLGTLRAIEQIIQSALARSGSRIEAFRYCTHGLDDRCACRKPEPGLLLDAAEELGLDLERSWMIGDTLTDVQAGTAAGCRTILLTSEPDGAGHAAADLSDAADLVLGVTAHG